MNIQIQINDPTLSILIIDGRKMEIRRKDGITKLEGMTKDTGSEDTLGGILASNLLCKVSEIIECIEDTPPEIGTWGKLDSERADSFGDILF